MFLSLFINKLQGQIYLREKEEFAEKDFIGICEGNQSDKYTKEQLIEKF